MNEFITSTQRFSLHDGPGIRTTVFMKGCPLHCPWCANPENLKEGICYYLDEQLCIGHPQMGCAANQSCSLYPGTGERVMQQHYEQCPVFAVKSYGSLQTEDELLKAILRDKSFYKDTGGVTFSGGEPLLHARLLCSICHQLSGFGINICVETCLFVPTENLRLIAPWINQYYIDIKLLDKDLCRNILGGNLCLFFKNLKFLKPISKQVILRFPIAKGLSDTPGNLSAVKRAVKDFQPGSLEIFGVHNLGKAKYKTLGMKYEDFEPMDSDELERIRDYLTMPGTPVIINSL